MSDRPLLFLDTETTGFGQCRLIEIAYASMKEEVTTLRCKPPIPITIESMEVHHITEKDVADLAPFTELGLGYSQLKERIENSILVAHDAKFDIGVLEREGIKVTNFIDTKKIARDLLPQLKHHRLQYLRYILNLDAGDAVAHSASGDVQVLKSLFAEFVKRVGNEEAVVSRWLNK